MKKTLSILLLLFLTSGCSTITSTVESIFPKKNFVTVSTNPKGADIIGRNGEVVGQTPLKISEKNLENIADNGFLSLEIRKEGYMPKQIFLELRGADQFEFKLDEVSEGTFNKYVLLNFSKQNNDMIRQALTIQGLMISRQYNQAQSALSQFQEKFPNIAASYVLQANLAISQGNYIQAQKHLYRAMDLDPTDPVVIRLMNKVRQRSPAGGNQ